MAVPVDNVRLQIEPGERRVEQEELRPVDVDVPVAGLVARVVPGPSDRIRLEERDMLRVEVELAAGDVQPAQDLLARPLLYLVPIEIQPQDLLDDFLDRDGQADRNPRLRLVWRMREAVTSSITWFRRNS